MYIFFEDHLVIKILSSKTKRYKGIVFEIPIKKISNSWFCVFSMLKYQFAMFPAPRSSPLFRNRVGQSSMPVNYAETLSFLKCAVSWIGLQPEYVGLHSLRRSGAGFLYSLGFPLQDIQSIGHWSSLAVLLYLCTPLERKYQIESSVASYLSHLIVSNKDAKIYIALLNNSSPIMHAKCDVDMYF